MSEYTQESNYIIAESGASDLYIFLSAKKDNPTSPKIIYDGKDHALFFRNDNQRIILDYINPEIREKLRQTRHVTMVETILENIKDTYWAEVQMVTKIPLNLEKHNLKAWDKVSLDEK